MKNIILVGFRGAGKSTVGKSLAENIGFKFVDLDSVFEQKFGAIDVFVEAKGIDEFRRCEFEILRDELSGGNIGKVIATGGGVVDWTPSVLLLENDSSVKVFLDWPVEVLWRRLQGHENRLNILNLNSFDRFEQLYNARLPKYNKIATLTLQSRAIKDALELLGNLRKNS